ncbi:MAG: hypothetical protein MZW92_22425 [Comamonadaceae bacterium]|nr:hypothetical protein [Comamonadaceae bacterium]
MHPVAHAVEMAFAGVGGALGALLSALANGLIGVAAGALVLAGVTAVRKLARGGPRRPEARRLRHCGRGRPGRQRPPADDLRHRSDPRLPLRPTRAGRSTIGTRPPRCCRCSPRCSTRSPRRRPNSTPAPSPAPSGWCCRWATAA